MASFISKLFTAPHSRGAESQRSARLRRGVRRRPEAALAVQSLEPRLALTVYAASGDAGSVVPLTGGGFAYNIVIDDTVDGSGYGRDAYLQRGSDGTQYFLLDNNPGFSSPKRLGVQSPTLGTCNTIFVTSGSRQGASNANNPAVNSSTYNYTLPSASPLGVSGTVTIGTPGGNLSFDYSGSALSFRGGASTDGGLTTWTITLNNPTAWTTAQYEAPTASVSLFGATSTLSFNFTDTVTKAPKAINSAAISNDSYLYFHSQTNPQSFTAFAGQNFDQRLIADLQPVGSSVSINSPWLASLGSAGDQPFYSAYDGGYNAGQISLYATSINVNQTATTTSRFAAGSTSRRQSGFNTPTLTTSVAAPVNAQNYAIEVTGSVAGSTTTHGSLLVSQTGSLLGSGGGAAVSMTVTSDWADIRFLGQVNVGSQNYLLRAIGSQDQFDFTTRSASTGIATGLVSGATVAMTLGQPAGGNVDLRTNIANLRFDSGVNASSIPYRYTVAIDEQNALQVDAVAASSGPISLKATGDMTVVGSAIRTSNDISLISSGTLSIAGDISTANGNVNLDAPTITLGSVVTAGGTRGVTLVSRTGDTTANALTRAGGTVKQTVQVASIQNVDLATNGLAAVDGVAINAGDRVLLKNQTTASQNGIYVASAGVWTRATDADTAGELPPGFAVFVSGGTQTGGWTLLNPATPILGQTGLQFAPVSATRTYDEVKAATTASITLSGTQTVDGVALVDGDRVLVKNQSNTAQNGIYVVSAGAWQRSGDADTTAELTTGSFVFVRTGGTVNGGKGFALANDVVQVGTSPINFADFFTAASGSTSWAPARVLPDTVVATTVNILLTGLQTVDGVTLAGGERVLVKNQINATENGVYIAAAGVWSRATDADAVSGLPRSTSVYVLGGTQGQNTSWQFNDSTQELGTTTANSANVTNLVSTTGLAVGMLVTGAGIPGGTVIASLGSNGTSLRLSQNATLSGSLTALSFVKNTAVVVGTDPVVFIPVGGSMTITAAKNIAGTSLLQGATALLTAGTGGAAASNLNTKTNFGRISAAAPGPIVVTNANSVELQNVSTGTAGGITVTADGTITALSVAATGTAGTPGNVSLTSIYGDVVAESITSNLGNIGLTSINGDVAVTKARLASANISASSGSITATADSAGAVITIDGRLNAAGAAGVGDISLLSNAGQLAFTGSANVVAADQLVISTPNSVPTIANGAQIAAARLDLTSQFGKGVNTPPAGLGTYQDVAINRTDAGDIVFTSASDLTVEGASTSDGSISFTAPNLSITGAILPQGPGADADVTLSATAGNLFIDNTVTSQRDVTLSAKAGEVRSSTTGNATALVTAPRDLTVNASSVANILAKATGLNSTMTAAGASLAVTDTDGLNIKSVTLSGGGGTTATFTIGSAGSGGDATIGKIDAGSTGTVTINAYGNIIEDTVDAGVADIVAGTANLNSTTGRIAVDTDVDILSAGVQQKNQNLVINDVGSSGLELRAVVGSNNANVNVTSKGTITATNVTTTGTITLTSTDPTSDILVNQVSSAANTVTLSAGRSILEVTPGDATPDVTGSAVVLTAGTGSINVHLAASTVAATATTLGSSITLKDDDSLALTGITSNAGNAITVSAGGDVTQTGGITGGGSLAVTNAAGSVILNRVDNDVATVSVVNPGRVITYRDATGFGIGAAGISGGAVTLTGNGNLTQTGLITATSLSVTDTAESIDFDLVGNNVASLVASNGNRPVILRTATALQVTGIQAGATFLRVGGDLTQTAAINASSLDVTASAGAVTLDRTDNVVTTFSGSNPGRSITFTDTTGFGIGANGLNGGAVVLAGNGNLTQTGLITATSLSVTDTAGSIDFDLVGNKIGGLSAANGNRPVIVRTATALQVTGLQAGAAFLRVGGDLTQTAAIKASSLDVTASAGAVTLDRSDNVVAAFSGSNPGRSISFTDTTGFGIGANGLNGGAVVLVGNGNLTQTGLITATSLSVTDTAGSIDFDLVGNKIGGLSAANGNRPVIVRTATALQVTGLQAGAAFLRVGGDLTQTAAIKASSLDLTASAGAVSLTNAGNSVGTLGVVSNPGGDVSFVNAGTFATTAITAGTAAVGDGNILLKSISGDINVNGKLTALNDRVTLEARNGTFTLAAPPVSIDAEILVYYVLTPPTYSPGQVPTIVAANGDLTISQSGPITFGGYTTDGNITITGTSVTINGLLQTTGIGKTVLITATAGDIAFVAAGAIDNAPALLGTTTLSATGTITALAGAKVSGATTSLTVGQAVTFPGTIDATTLNATGAGTAISLTGSNTLGTVGITKGSDVVVNDTTGPLALSGITATGSVTVTAAGAVTQTGGISGGALSVIANGNPITLNTQNNSVTSFASSNGAGNIAFKDTAGGLALAVVTGGTVTIDAAGAVTQTGAVTAGAFTVNAAGNAITLNTQNNAVTSFASSNAAGDITFKDTAGTLALAGVTGGTVTINAVGAVSQTGAVNVGAFTVNAAGNGITLNTQNNAVTSFASSNGVGNIAFKDTAGGLVLAGVTGGTVTIDAVGAVSQTGAVNATALVVNAVGKAITLNTQANTLGSFSSSNAGGSITLADTSGDLTLDTITSGPLTVVAAGKVLANQVQVTGAATITTANGGGLDVGPLANGRLTSTGQLDLRGVQGQVRLINGGQISGSPILVNSTYTINVGGVITTTDQLNQAVATVNTMPTIVGSTYEILVGANLVLSQTIVANRPMTLRGTSGAITLNGSATATTGMTVNAGGSGSRITSLAFSGFSGTGVQLNAAQNVAVSGVTVNYSGYGLSVSGASTGSTVRGNVFNFCPNAIVLTSATGVTIGGTAAGQPNRINSSARAGVFATGFCTGSSVIKTVFLQTPTPYNVRAARNIRIVN